MEEKYPILVELFDNMGDNEIGIIIKCNSGIYYTNQTGGMCCNHPIIEGSMMKFHIDEDFYDDLCHITCDFYSKEIIAYDKNNVDKLSNIYDEIDKYLWTILHPNLTGYKVTLDRNEPQQEAWLHVIFEKVQCDHPYMCIFGEFNTERFEAVLTYANSD